MLQVFQLSGYTEFLGQYIPLFNAGMGWLLPRLSGQLLVTLFHFNLLFIKKSELKKETL